MNINIWKTCLIGASCLSMTLVNTSEAQTIGLEEIVVTAQKREQSQKDVPISMSVFNDDWVKRNTIGTFKDLSQRIPNFTTSSVPGTDTISLRGIGSGNNAGFEQSVATFVDGVYRSRSKGIQLALFDLERIEVLKGPQVTYFGNNAIAGALSATTRKPEPGQDLTYNANASYSWDDGEYIVEGGVSNSLTETLAGRVALKAYGMDGYVRNEFLDDDEPNLEHYAIRVSLAWEPTDSWRSDLRLDYGRERSEGVTPAELIECPPTLLPPAVAAGVLFSPVNVCARYLNANGGVVDDELDFVGAHGSTYLDFDQYESVLTNTWSISDKSRLTAVTSFTSHELETLLELTPVPILNNNGTPHFLPVVPIEESREFAQELRFESSIVDDLEYMLGGYYGRSDLDYDLFGGYFFLEPVAGMSLVSLSPHEQETDTYSAFGSATYHVSEDFRINAGLRYLRSEKEAHREGAVGVSTAGIPSHDSFVPLPLGAQLGIAPVLGVDLGDYADPTHTDSGFMTSVDLQYDLNDETMAYLKYSRGFKAGGFSFAPQEGTFDKEEVDAYELGIKTFLFDRSVSLDVVAYLSEYTDFQEAFNEALPTGAAILVVENVGKATSKGVETSIAWRAAESLTVFADLAYLDAKYDSFPDAQCDSITSAQVGAFGCVADLSGRERVNAPDFSGNLGMNFIFPVQGDRVIRFDPLVYFRSEYYTLGTLDPLSLQEGWEKVDVSLSYGAQDESWEVGLFGKNITDEHTCGLRNTVPAAPGTAYCDVQRGRSFGIKFSIRH